MVTKNRDSSRVINSSHAVTDQWSINFNVSLPPDETFVSLDAPFQNTLITKKLQELKQTWLRNIY